MHIETNILDARPNATRPAAVTLDILIGRAPPPPVVSPPAPKRAAPFSVSLPRDSAAEDRARRREDIAAYIAANAPVTTAEIMAWAEIDSPTVGGDLRSLRMSKRVRQIGRTSKIEGQSAIWEPMP